MNWRMKLGWFGVTSLVAVAWCVTPAEAVITHRYSFTSNANDSVGTAHWTVNGGATFSGGQVHLDGIDDYLSREGAGTTPLPTSGSMTIEVWGTYATGTAVGSRIFDFDTASGAGYMYFTPRSTPLTPEGNPQDPAVNGSNTRWRWNDNSGSFPDIGPMASSPANINQEVLFTLVFDAAASTPLGIGEFRLYQDGLLIATDSAENLNILGFEGQTTTSHRLGHGISVPTGTTVRDLPAFLTGSFNEFRIYNNPLTQLDVLNNLITGPDQTSVSFTDKTWNAGTSDWNTGGNWTAAGVPAVGNRAIIGNGGTATVSGAVPQVGTVRMTNGTISIGAGGSLNSKYPIEMNTGDANSATINVTNGGVLAVGGILPDAGLGAKTINIDGGIIRPGFKAAIVTPGGTTPQTTSTTIIGANGATFQTLGTDSITWTSKLSGSGHITKTGTGTLVLRPYATGLGLDDQNPAFNGEVFINAGAVDVQREHGVFGKAGSTQSGKVHMNGATLIINTAFPINFRKEFPADLEINGVNELRNMVDRAATEIRMEGALTGDGTLRFTKPVLVDALGVDFLNHVDALAPNGAFFPVDNSGFTGRLIFDGNWAIRFFATILDPDAVPNSGDEQLFDDTDFPNAVLEMANAGAWMGKRGSSPNQLIRIGGLEGVAGSRLQAAIAGPGDPLADVTYQIGGASEDCEFFGNVIDDLAVVTDNVSIVKVGSNVQTFAGTNAYSGTTTINGGTLRVNGTHQMDPVLLLPIGDYTVNTGGTLGGTGTIGSAGDPVNVNLNGGAINPGASVGTLTVNGNVDFGDNGIFEVEIDANGNVSDQLVVNGNLDLSGLGDMLKLSLVAGSLPEAGPLTIATYTGSLTGTFNLDNATFNINYGTGTNSAITISNITAIDGAGLAGDYNNDGTVDAGDYVRWRNNLGDPTEADINNNGDGGGVTISDYGYWKARYGNPGSGGGGLAGSAQVPEPAAALLLVLGGILCGMARRRN